MDVVLALGLLAALALAASRWGYDSRLEQRRDDCLRHQRLWW